jgi:hypothetical protein
MNGPPRNAIGGVEIAAEERKTTKADTNNNTATDKFRQHVDHRARGYASTWRVLSDRILKNEGPLWHSLFTYVYQAARHEDGYVPHAGGGELHLKRGQALVSCANLAKLYRINATTISRRLKRWQREGLVIVEHRRVAGHNAGGYAGGPTIVTCCHYDFNEQAAESRAGAVAGQKATIEALQETQREKVSLSASLSFGESREPFRERSKRIERVENVVPIKSYDVETERTTNRQCAGVPAYTRDGREILQAFACNVELTPDQTQRCSNCERGCRMRRDGMVANRGAA